MSNFNSLIQEVCQELDIKFNDLSGKWVIRLEKNDVIKFIYGYKFPLNDHSSGNLVDDKGLLYDLLTFHQIPIIEHHVVYKDYDKEDVINYFNSHNKEIIVKGNVGTCGNEVYKVNNEVDLLKTIEYLFLSQYSISLCPFYRIKTEYRSIVLNGVVRVLYGKKRQVVIGDGIKNVYQLSLDYNKDYYIKHEVDNKDYVPKNGEEYLLNFKFNLSNGTRMFLDIDENKKDVIIKMALKVSKKSNINFGSVDIIETMDNELLVMEVNSGVMMNYLMKQNGDNGYKIAKEVYKDAIKAMFDL